MRAAAQLLEAAPSRSVIGLAAMGATNDGRAVLVTYALGSCLGVAVHDPVAGVGGMLHAMMPRSEIDVLKAARNPALFVDTGIPALFRACYALGARKERLRVWLAGAASLHGPGDDQFQVGKRNLLTARQLFWKNSVMVHAQEVGGETWRTMTLDMQMGDVLVRSGGPDRLNLSVDG
jgi:chemotaxis protein CheD